MELPNLTQRVTDFSNTLTTSQLDDINTTAKSYEDETSNQVFVVLFPQRQGNELIDIGTKVFNENDIGQKDKNNGLLLLISTEEKKIRIIVGYGLESIYPDLVASQIIENDIRPLVNKWDFYGAIKVFYEKSKEVIGWEYIADPVDPYAFSSYTVGSEEFKSLLFSLVFIFIFGTIGFLSARSFFRRQHKKYSTSKQKKMMRWIIGTVIVPLCLAIISLFFFLFNTLGSWTIMCVAIFNIIPFMSWIFGIVKFGNPRWTSMTYTPWKGWRPWPDWWNSSWESDWRSSWDSWWSDFWWGGWSSWWGWAGD